MPKNPRHLINFQPRSYLSPSGIGTARLLESGLSITERQFRQEWLTEVTNRGHSDFYRKILQTFSDPSDSQILRSLLAVHGLFAERFFHRNIRERVFRLAGRSLVEIEQFEASLSSELGYRCRVYGRSDVIYHITKMVYDDVAVRAISEPDVLKKLENWFEECSARRACNLCGNQYFLFSLPEWIYYGSNGVSCCCFRCEVLRSPKKSELPALIRRFVESCGFVPRSDAGPVNYSFTSRLSSNQWLDVFRSYANMGGTDHVSEKFGSWFAALALAGALPDGVQRTARGIRCLARDGHIARSLDERRIDDWLSEHGLPHELEPPYPYHVTLNSAGKKRADWRVRGTFIEYFGLVDDLNYERRMHDKILLAEHCKIDMIVIYPWDIEKLDQRLECLMSEGVSQRTNQSAL